MAIGRGTELDLRLVDLSVRAADGTLIGEVEGVRPLGVRLHRIPGHPRRAGYLPGAAFAQTDEITKTLFLRPRLSIERILDAPLPPEDTRGRWRRSADWWAELANHSGPCGPAGPNDGALRGTLGAADGPRPKAAGVFGGPCQ